MRHLLIFFTVMLIVITIHSSSFANAQCKNAKWDMGDSKVAIDSIGQALGILPEVPTQEKVYFEQEYNALFEHSVLNEQRYAALSSRPYYYIWNLTKELNIAKEDFYKISDAEEKTAFNEKIHLATRSIKSVIRVV